MQLGRSSAHVRLVVSGEKAQRGGSGESGEGGAKVSLTRASRQSIPAASIHVFSA